MLQAATKIPELELSDDEAAKLAECSSRVMEYYTGIVSEKSQAWMALMMAIGGVYGSRAVAIYLRRRAETEAAINARKQAAANDPTQQNFGTMGQ